MVPTLITDTREQTPLEFAHLPNERGTLQSGDYSIKGLEHDFAIERKSVKDLLGSVTRHRERFERELHRLRGFPFARVLIVGEPYEVMRLAQNPKAIFGSVSSFECRYNVPFIWEPTAAAAALQIERWAWFYWRDRLRVEKTAGTCPLPASVIHGHARAITEASRDKPA